MKKWIITVLIGIFTAGSALAQGPLGSDEAGGRRQGDPRHRPAMSERKRAQIEKFKAEREAARQLAETARSEADPAKKAVLVDELRTKLTKGAEKMQAEHRKRLQKAEQGVEKMKARLAEAEKNKEQRVEQHVQDLLAGKKPERPEWKRHQGGPHGKGSQPPVE